ncbi:hypothetical protein [Candidatus Enterococcus testudinis]
MRKEQNHTVLMISHGPASRHLMRHWESISKINQSSKFGNYYILKFYF